MSDDLDNILRKLEGLIQNVNEMHQAPFKADQYRLANEAKVNHVALQKLIEKALGRPRGEYVAARKALNALYLEYVNNYLTIEKFAENNGLTTDQGQRLIELAREIHNSPHPEG